MPVFRTFSLYKHGTLVNVKFTGSDRFTAQGTYEPLPIERIVGVDTESLERRGVLDTVLIPLWFHTGKEVIEVSVHDNPLELMLDAVCNRFSIPDYRPSRTKQRVRRYNDNGRLVRDGRRETIDPVLLVFFNLPYDIGRLCSKTPQLLRALASGADTYTVTVGKYSVEVAKMILGSGSSFDWYVRENDRCNSRITRLLGIDVHGYWKTSLAASAKALGVSQKLDVEQMLKVVNPRIGDDREWFRIPYEEFSEDEWEVVKKYAAGDAQSTAELYSATVDLLRTVDARVVRRTGVVPPSAPGSAARIAFAKAFDSGRMSWKRYPAWADQLGCDAYRGGRAFCAKPGKHTGMIVRDIKSAYPYALTVLPDPVTVQCEAVHLSSPSILRELKGLFGVLVIDGEGLDPVYPALRCHDDERGRLRGVYGRFFRLAATIPEVVIGVTDGSLRVTAIHGGVIMRGNPESSFLRKAMLDFFAIKDNPSNHKALRDTGKLLANSTYGKLIEVQCTQYWLDSDIMCPPYKDLEKVAEELASLYAETPIGEFEEQAAKLIERSSNHYVSCRDIFCRGCGPEPVLDGPAVPLRRRMVGLRTYKAGQYFMPLYASQVTGFISAALGLMARCTGAAQGDTDSIHTIGWCDDRVEEFYSVMKDAGYNWPRTGLGSWSIETLNPSEESYCARVKLYSHYFSDSTVFRCQVCGAEPGVSCDHDSRHYKQAKHGFSKYPGGSAALHDAIAGIVSGKPHVYETRPSPRKVREALIHGLPVGEFVSREIKVMAEQDPCTDIINGVAYWKPLEKGSRYLP
jgi:hypothetical protein